MPRPHPHPAPAYGQVVAGGPPDVVGLGSAIVDLLVPVEPQAVASAGLEPGTMTLIDAPEARRLWEHFGQAGAVVAGGSAANTVVGVAALGARAALVGRLGDDTLGEAYVVDLESAGAGFVSAGPPGEAGTGRSFIIVTPDGERTMRTYLGAAPELDAQFLSPELFGPGTWLYLEGYLWDAPAAEPAVGRALELARAAGASTALSLSDPGCVERHRSAFAGLVAGGAIDLLFANEAEITQLWETADFNRAVEVTGAHCEAALTRGAAGSVVVTGDDTLAVGAVPARVVDTTGAGDLYAAGFLAGRVRGLDRARCAQLAGLAAADIISDFGARPHHDLLAVARGKGLPL